jgi:DNA-binding MarR family transcriptional regulator
MRGMASDVDAVAAWRCVLLTRERVVRAIEQDLRDAGEIPLTWYDVLLELNAAPEHALRMQDLGARVVLSRSRVSRLVDDLERRGYVERRPDVLDGRATLATMTPAGRQAFRRAAKVYLRGIEQHFTRHIPPADQHSIVHALQPFVDDHGSRPG